MRCDLSHFDHKYHEERIISKLFQFTWQWIDSFIPFNIPATFENRIAKVSIGNINENIGDEIDICTKNGHFHHY